MHEFVGTGETYFYEDLSIYRLLLLVKNNGDLETYVPNYISTVSDYDQKMGRNLFEKLHIFLEFSGSKKETMDRFFLVR